MGPQGMEEAEPGTGAFLVLQEQSCQAGVLNAKVALHPPPVSIKTIISILTTQLIRHHELNYDRGGSAINLLQELRVIDQNRHMRS